MPDPMNVAVEKNDNLDPVVKAGIIEHHEHNKAEKQAEKDATEAEKKAQSEQEYKEVTGHDPIDPLSF